MESLAVPTRAGSLRVAYRTSGDGPAVLLVHGWPTSSFLWRDVMRPIAERNRVIAVDLPGFGASDKPLDASYSFRFYGEVLDGFVEALGLESFGLAVHDLGGPVGVWWALQRPERLERLALLNTLLYPRPSWAVIAFALALRTPGVRRFLTSRRGLEMAMHIGMARRERITGELIDGVARPFQTGEARRALVKTALGLSPKGMFEIARRLPRLRCPVRVIYGERDRILPDVARTMERVASDLPQTELTALADCGHFLQEDDSERIGALLAEFFAGPPV